MVSGKMGIGAVLVALGIGGIVYAMPIESSSMIVSNNSPVIYDKVAPPALPPSMVPYLGIVAASVVSLVIGIALMAVGETEVFKEKKTTTRKMPPATRNKVEEEDTRQQQPQSSSFKHTADAA